jgi:hypothetical protein
MNSTSLILRRVSKTTITNPLGEKCFFPLILNKVYSRNERGRETERERERDRTNEGLNDLNMFLKR